MMTGINHTSITVRDIDLQGKIYPVKKIGQGIPCLVIGIGTLFENTLSPTFFAHFETYISDLYWVTDHALTNPSSVTMDTLVDDIKSLGEALELSQYIILAHSAYGIVALEFAKKYPHLASGIIMVGTPVNLNPQVAEQNNRIFEQQADQDRKRIDAERRTQIASEDLNSLNTSERFLREYIYRDAPRYWHDSSYDCTPIWKGIVLDKLIDHFYSTILHAVDVTTHLSSISTPIFLAAGVSDYDCCPWLWNNVKDLPPRMAISIFDESGHWPHFEKPEVFDERILQWVKSLKNQQKRAI
jgi:pimeloyl-ACP methyl ester carboxylesterase